MAFFREIACKKMRKFKESDNQNKKERYVRKTWPRPWARWRERGYRIQQRGGGPDHAPGGGNLLK